MLLKLFKNDSEGPPFQGVAGERVYIRPPEKGDGAAWIALKTRNHDFLKPWSPTRAMQNIDRDGFLNRLNTYQADWKEGRAYAFFIFRDDTDELIGGLSLNNVVRAAAQMTNIGYWLDEAQTRQGYMTEAVLLACQFAFRTLKLHRIEAGTLPENLASQKVLNNCGFLLEGHRRKYLKIAGEWRDHLIFSLLSEEFISLGGPAS
jgi:[ribosomal protein S5]-alanine N-acetyltransferase